ncbi:MAG: methyl-accepting chemotaxis protein [Thermodesulfobacteriota bacterium]
MKLKLRERLLLPILGLIILGMGITIVTSNKYSKAAISETTENSMIQTVENIRNAFDSWLLKQETVIDTMTSIKIFSQACRSGFAGRAKRTAANKILANFKKDHAGFESIFLADLNGDVVASSNESMIDNKNISQQQSFKNALEENSTISGARKSAETEKTVFSISYPLYDGNLVIGAITGVVNLSDFTDSIKDLKIGKTGYVYMCNQEGLAVYHPDKNAEMKASLADYDWGKKMLSQKNGYMEYKWSGTDTISVFRQSKVKNWLIISRVSPDEIFAGVYKLQQLNLIIAASTIIVLSICIILLARFIILKPVNLALDFAKKISSGDLTARMELNRKDELGALVHSLNGMGDSLKEMFQIQALRKLVENLSSDSANLKKISLKMTEEIENTAEKSNTVSNEAVEMTDNIGEVSEALEESTANISAVAAGAEEMTSTIQEIAENTSKTSSITKDAVEKTKGASERIDFLGGAAKEIGEVTTTIRDISDQTNLLALNATIEAARAGEAGKGFAVVAEEIKNLALQTSNATADIAEKIKNIQDSTDKTVSDINGIGSTIDEVDSLVSSIAAAIEEQSATTAEISESVNHASSKISGVNETMTENSGSVSRITKDISEISKITEELRGGSRQVSESSEDLEALSSEVRKLVDRFKI